MVYIHFPSNLTEEEEMLQKKYAKLRKKKRALQALRAPKPEPPAPVAEKKPAEAAADATEQAKKLIKSGAIRLESDKREQVIFKRSKRMKEDSRVSSVGFQPFNASHDSEQEDEKPESKAKMKTLYDSFVKDPKLEKEERKEIREREPRERREEPPKKGNTVYVYGHGLNEDMLRKAATNFGTIVNITMENEKNCGFVTFEKMESADSAIAEMNGSMVSGVQLKVSMARRQPTFENPQDASTASWASIAASHSQKGAHKDKRTLIAYDDSDDIF